MQELKENRAIDLFVTYRFLRLLTTPFEKQDAFKYGIIDKDGKVLRKARSLRIGREKTSYTLLHRLVFNFKRILKKVGLGGRLGTYAAAAIALLKETYNNSDVYEKEIYRYLINEGYKFDTISEDAPLNSTGDAVQTNHPLMHSKSLYRRKNQQDTKRLYKLLKKRYN